MPILENQKTEDPEVAKLRADVEKLEEKLRRAETAKRKAREEAKETKE